MTEGRRFFHPDLSDQRPNFVRTPDNETLSIGWAVGELSDGRPYRVDYWVLDGMSTLTYFLPTEGLEEYGREDFADLLEREGLLRYLREQRSAHPVMVNDALGRPLWSVNVCVGVEDEVTVEDLVPLRSCRDDPPPFLDRVRWEDLAPAAPALFNIWLHEPELAWAENAWHRLLLQGKTTFVTELGRTEVLLRFAALAGFYHSWSRHAWDEGSVVKDKWLAELEVPEFRLAQLAGEKFLDDVQMDQSDLIELARDTLFDAAYATVRLALRSTFSSDSELFVWLWGSRLPSAASTEGGRINNEFADVALREDLNRDKLAGFDWITAGCPLSDSYNDVGRRL